MNNINVSLTPYLKQYLERKIGNGRYNNVSEVIREALRLLEQQDIEREARLAHLRTGSDLHTTKGDEAPRL